MSAGLSYDIKEQVRQAIDIVDLVGGYLQLRREGRTYKALCPWHNDRRPSLTVNPERQTYRCFVCNLGGDVFSFVERMEGVSFAEAVRILADRAGIRLAARGGGAASGDDVDQKRNLYQCAAWAEQQFHQCLLRSPEAEAARGYLVDRGITTDTIARFHLGYSPDRWDWILKQAQDTRFTPQILEQVGLVGARPNGNGWYDRFKGRVLFSIRDAQGRPVGMGGRVLPGNTDERAAKYVNSPETPLFSKSNLLYGLDAAKDVLSKLRTAIVMEGYTDCLIAQQCGLGNALAVLGTALNERHIRLLRRFVDRVILVLDGDEAGRRRTEEILSLFVAAEMDLRILTLPDELDPADFLLARGKAAFDELLAGALDAMDHKFRLAESQLSIDGELHAATRAVEDILAVLAKAPRTPSGATGSARLKEEQILHRLARRAGLDELVIRQRLAELRKATRRADTDDAAPAVPALARSRISSRREKAERWLLQILIEVPEHWPLVRNQIGPEQIMCPLRRQVFCTCCELLDAGQEPTFARLLLELHEPAVQSLLVELDDEQRALRRADPAKELRDLLQVFGEDQAQRHDPRDALSAAGSPQESDESLALQNILQRERSRQGISVPTDG